MARNPDMLSENMDNFDWLEDSLNEIYEDIVVDIADDRTANRAIEALLVVMPFVCMRADLPRWQYVLIKAMIHAQVLKDIDSQIQLWSYLGMCFFRKGKHKNAIVAFNQALTQIDPWVTPDINLTARIGMLHGQAIFHAQNIDEFVQDTIIVAQQVEDETLLARFHITLAIAYTHRARTDLALGHAQTAFAYWAKLNFPAEQDRALLMMAEACRVAGLYPLARYYLDRSLSRYTHVFQSAIANYQEGALAHMNEAYEEAQSRQEAALSQFKMLGDYPYLTGAAHHALGLTYTRLGAFTVARGNLREAMAIWLQLDNIFEQANALYGLGFLEQQQAHYTSAREFYLDALERLATLAPSPMIDDLKANINDSLNELPL